jgi:hypothetical protein
VEKKSFSHPTNRERTPNIFEEGFRIVAVMPILAREEVIGCLIMASKVITDVSGAGSQES